MAVKSLGPAGTVGIITDLNPAELPPLAWTSGQNVQFQNGAVHAVWDSTPLLTAMPTQINWALPSALTSSGGASWVLAGNVKAYAYVAATLTDITRASGGDYTGGVLNRWSGGVLSGVTVLNNGADAPQAWLSPDTGTKLIDLPNWPSGYKASCLRSYKQYLVALDITKPGGRYPTLVKWSHPADPGTVPVSWNEADPTRDAGEYPLSETPGYCVDCVPLRDTNIIYKQDSVWGMQYIGGTYIFKFYKIFGDFGVPGRDCVIEYTSGKHFVFTGSDLVIHDGQNQTSIASGKVRSLLKTMTIQQLRTAFVTLSPVNTEVWFCYRRATDNVIATDTVITWNWVEGTFGFRKVPDYRFIANGRLDPPVTGVVTWANIGGTWDSHPEEWGESIVVPALIRMLGIGTLSLNWLGAVPVSTDKCWIERIHLGVQLQADQPPDMSVQKFVTRIWPRITGTAGTVLRITLGTSDSVATPVDWRAPLQYIIGTDSWLDLTLTGKLFSIRIESEKTTPWTYNGMDAEIIVSGAN